MNGEDIFWTAVCAVITFVAFKVLDEKDKRNGK